MEGFTVWKNGRRNTVTVTKNGVMIPARIAGMLPGEYCNFGWNGKRQFVLEPGSDLHIYRQKNNRSIRINNKRLLRFIWSKLGKQEGTRLDLPYKIIDNSIVFGDL